MVVDIKQLLGLDPRGSFAQQPSPLQTAPPLQQSFGGRFTPVQGIAPAPAVPPPPPEQTGFFNKLISNPGISDALLRFGSTLLQSSGRGESLGQGLGAGFLEASTALRDQSFRQIEARKAAAEEQRKNIELGLKIKETGIKERGVVVKEAKLEQPDLTSLQQNLAATGLQPGTPEFQEALLKNISKSGVQVNIGEKATGKILGQILPDVGKTVSKQARASSGVLDIVSGMEELLDQGLTTGFFTPAKATIMNILSSAGVDINKEELAQATNFTALANAATKELIATATFGSLSKGEMDFLKDQIAKLGNDTQANRLVLAGIKERFGKKVDLSQRFNSAIAGGRFEEALNIGSGVETQQQRQRFKFNPQTGRLE